MKSKIKSTDIVFGILLLMVVANFIIFPNLFVVHIFTTIYLIFIYKKFANNKMELIYFSTILFGFIDVSLVFPIGSRYALYYYYIGILIYMSMILYKVIKGEYKINLKQPNRYLIFLIVFIFYTFFSIFFANDKKLALRSIINYIMMFSIVLMFIHENKTKEKLGKLFQFFWLVNVGITLLGILEICHIRYGVRNHYFDMGIFASYVQRIPVVFFYNPNNYAVFLILSMIALVIGTIYTKDRNKRILLSISFVLNQINLIFTTSRTCWICLFLSLAFIFVLSWKSKRKVDSFTVVKYSILSIILFVLFSFLPVSSVYYGKFDATPILSKFNIVRHIQKKPDVSLDKDVSIGSEGSDSERYTLLYDVVRGVFHDKHLLGFGAGNISTYIKKMNNTFNVLNVHSLWFEILGDFGICIFLYVIYIYGNMLICNFRNYFINEEIKEFYLFGATSGFAFIFLAFAPSTIVAYTPFWMFIGISMSLVLNFKKITNK